MSMPVGLRIDVDTLRGTRDGVPALVTLFAKYDIKATFYMSVGPDNMGRHLWRLFKPKFLWKMLRSNAASLYGYDILLRGTAWPGLIIGDYLADTIRLPQNEGHEVGLHAWDHYSWQAKIDRFSPEVMRQHLQKGVNKLSEILRQPPLSSASAGWRCNDQALLLKETFGFQYNSDCRGDSIFRPVVAGKTLLPQIPTTLPTYDEVIGVNGVTDANYNDFILSRCQPNRLNVYTIHAEVEGMGKKDLFEAFLIKAKAQEIQFLSLRDFIRPDAALPTGEIACQPMAGREGWLAQQKI